MQCLLQQASHRHPAPGHCRTGAPPSRRGHNDDRHPRDRRRDRRRADRGCGQRCRLPRDRRRDVPGARHVRAGPHPHSTAEATLQTASIGTGTADRDAHLRSGDFLEAEKYPEITIRNARIQSQKGAGFTVVGDLTIKDTTRPVTLDVEIDGVAKDPYGNEKLAVTASTEIDREEFGMTWNVALETGGVLVSKKVKLEIEAQAARQA